MRRRTLAPFYRSFGHNMGGNCWLRGSSPWCSWWDMLWGGPFHFLAVILGDNMDGCRGCREMRNIFISAVGIACWKGLERSLSVNRVRYWLGLFWGGKKSLQLVGDSRRHSRGWNMWNRRPDDKETDHEATHNNWCYTCHVHVCSILFLKYHAPWKTAVSLLTFQHFYVSLFQSEICPQMILLYPSLYEIGG